ncbi:nickel-responsive transcriptional regulator NikR [Sagittula stellata]|uniref:Transcriptionalregulator, CopG family protein n=1 Tax=Sagittula stellata (strain ATCC 700073 / DSM 11524 / E-37) TaxID=388399 RepID=A3K349_SAGS3|nr:nickel-responsive transcriptional regulator NikR [Sagittula stellata]EBA08608.1 transcriptionalregulator, CopG family protein [Sagittula stellata E-37]
MQRTTIAIEDDLLAELDQQLERSGAINRSEAIRALLRRSLTRDTPQEVECIGVVSYTLDFSARELGRRVPHTCHSSHDQAVAALSVPLDHTNAMEVTVMSGRVADVEDDAHGLFAERGIRHGQLSLVPVKDVQQVHQHGRGQPHRHSHLTIKDRF